MKSIFAFTVSCSLLLGLVSCSSFQKNYSQEEIKKESAKANALFEEIYKENLQRSPMSLTYTGSKKRYDELGDNSYDFYLEGIKLAKKNLKEVKNLKYEALNAETKLSYRLMKDSLKSSIEGKKYYDNGYVISQMYGAHSQLAAFMINMHQIQSQKDAQAYIKRLWQFKPYLKETINHINRQEDTVYPFFIFDKVISDSKNLITGAPFNRKAKTQSPLYRDFTKKVDALDISKTKKSILDKEIKNALNYSVKPAYKLIIDKMTRMKSKNSKEAYGIWKQENGRDYYSHLLEKMTTTDYSAEKIHELGLSEVERIHGEMKEIARKLNLKPEISVLFKHVKSQKELFYPDTKKGRENYLKDTKKIIANMKDHLDELFITLPKAELTVKPVEPFREKSAGIAFYQRPALNGSRPGIYYVNLSDMSSVAKYDMEALAYHEAIPGHHMQLALAQEMSEDVPTFRKMTYYTAFSEGWGLYSEYIPKEIGMYKDLYSDFGRLSMELWRAARLVVDTGIHHHKWSYEKSLNYLRENTPNSEDEIVKGIQRYFVYPAQATTYKIGQLKILELKRKYEKKLGDKFDIRKFHDAILRNGTVPLYEMEREVDKEFGS